MPSPIPPILAPYLEDCFSCPSQTLLTSVLDASNTWLVLRLIAAGLRGVDLEEALLRNTNRSAAFRSKTGKSVLFVSFLRSSELWIELGKKMGLDLALMINNKQLAYIDGLSIAMPGSSSTILSSTKLNSHNLQDIKSSITTAKQTLFSSTTTNDNCVLVIDGIDFVLASQSELSHFHLTQFCTGLREEFSNVVLTTSADSPLLHNSELSATPLELDHSMFVRMMAYQSTWVMQTRPLETGQARDVTGVVRLSKGGSDDTRNDKLQDGEWLYQVKGDGSVRVWSRGE